MVSKLDLQTFMSEFNSHWVPHSYGLVLHLSKKLCREAEERREIITNEKERNTKKRD